MENATNHRTRTPPLGILLLVEVHHNLNYQITPSRTRRPRSPISTQGAHTVVIADPVYRKKICTTAKTMVQLHLPREGTFMVNL